MTDILKSPAGLVFLLMAGALVAGLFTGHVDPKDFQVLAGMAFAFYFVTPSTPGGLGGAK